MPCPFIVKSDLTVILSKEARQLCEFVPKITEEQLKYVIMAYDYINSPWRLYPLERRKELAKRKVWGDKDFVPEEFGTMVKAIDEYVGLIYDSRRHMRDALIEKLELLNTQIITTVEPTQLRNIINSTKIVEERVEEIDNQIDKDEQAVILKGKRKLSFVELFMQNRENYRARMATIMESIDGQDGV